MVGAGAHKRQTQSHVDALLNAKVFHRDQPVVVRHGDHDVEFARVCFCMACAHEHRVGCIRPTDVDAFAARRLNRRRNDEPFFVAEQTALACMRIQAGHRDARPRLAPGGCAAVSNPNGAEHSLMRHRVDGTAQRHVDGHQHTAQFVVGQHHAHLRWCLSGHGRQRLEHFGVTRKWHRRRRQRFFVDGRGHDGRDFAAHRQRNRLLDTSRSRGTGARINPAHRRFHQ